MTYQMRPPGCYPTSFKGAPEKLIVSRYENNYGRAMKRLNVITEQLAVLDFVKVPAFAINGPKREE